MKLITVFTILLFLTQSTVSREITIGSKKFTESVILGEMARQMVESTEHLISPTGTGWFTISLECTGWRYRYLS